jgi:hypothetical protein
VLSFVLEAPFASHLRITGNQKAALLPDVGKLGAQMEMLKRVDLDQLSQKVCQSR